MEQLFDQVQTAWKQLDSVCIFLVLAAGFFQKRYLAPVNLSGALKTLIVSVIFCSLYLVALRMSGQFKKEMLSQWLFSYFVATSFYELFLKKWASKLMPDKNEQP